MNSFETFPECSLPSTVSKNTIKMIGHHSRLRDVMGQSYLICASTVLVLIMRVIHRSTLHFFTKVILGKKLDRQKVSGIQNNVYKICGNISHMDLKRSQSCYFCGHNLHHRVMVSCTLFAYIFFLPINFLVFF